MVYIGGGKGFVARPNSKAVALAEKRKVRQKSNFARRRGRAARQPIRTTVPSALAQQLSCIWRKKQGGNWKGKRNRGY